MRKLQIFLFEQIYSEKRRFPQKTAFTIHSNSLRTSLASLPLVSGRNAADTADMHRETAPYRTKVPS